MTDSSHSPDAPQPDAAGVMLVRALNKARWITFWERLWPPLAAIATAIGLFLARTTLGRAVFLVDRMAAERRRLKKRFPALFGAPAPATKPVAETAPPTPEQGAAA